MRDTIKFIVILGVGVIGYISSAGPVLPEKKGLLIIFLFLWMSIGGLYCVGNRWTLRRVPIVTRQHGDTFWLVAAFVGILVPLVLLLALYVAIATGYADKLFV